MKLREDHLSYLKERGANPERLAARYCSGGSDLRILYCDPRVSPIWTASKICRPPSVPNQQTEIRRTDSQRLASVF